MKNIFIAYALKSFLLYLFYPATFGKIFLQQHLCYIVARFFDNKTDSQQKAEEFLISISWCVDHLYLKIDSRC
jgi:hypothetical protein